MIDILSGHIDYIYFSTSLAFLFLAAVCLTAGNTRGQGLPWIWLGLFAATQVAWQWLELIAFSYFGGMYAETSRAALLAASFVFLVEFGRAGMANILGRGPERWVHLPLLVLAALCLFVELCQFKSSALLVLGCTAGLWAPLTLYMYSTIEKQPAGRGILRTISFALFLYAGINVLTLINVPFIPNEQDNFTTALIRILLGLLASCIALSGWMYLLAGSYKAGSPARRNYILAVVITFLGILVAGWLVTGLAGSQGAAQASHNLLSRTLTAASAVDAGMVASLEGSGAGLNTPEYFYLREQLRSIKQVNKDCRFVYLLGQRDGKVIFFVDAEPEQSIDYSAPGDLYNDSSPELMTVFSTGQPLVEGPLQDQWGDWVSGLAAISDPDSNLVIAVLGMDVAADDWQRLISVYRMAAFFIITIISLITIGFTIALQLNWQTANRLAASRARFEAIFKNAPEAIVIFEEDTGRILGTNPFMSHWTGFSKAELGELVIGDLINPGTASQEYLIEVLKSGSEITCHCRKRDSTLVEAEMTGAMLNYQGRKCLLVFLHDVTERRSREKMLTQQASAIEASMDGIAITDDSGRYLFMNEAYAKIYGYDLPEEPMGKNWSTLYCQQEIAWLEKEVFPELLQRGYWRGESMGIKRNGTMFPQDVSLSRIDGGGLVCIVRDITERKLAQDKIEYLAYYDALTGLPNRTLFKNRLALALVQANRDKKMLAVMFLDLDRFKFTNDTLGHSAGDKLLQRVSRRLAKCVRQGDTIARIGGDEFTLLLQELSRIEDAARVAQKINGVLQRPVGINGYEIDISASIGIAIYPDDGEDVETLLKNADIAMYQAKGTGGNSYRFYDPAMNVRTLERLVLQNNLRYALQREEFILHYQPQVDVRTGKVTGVEALLRWQHPELGLVLPSEFISQAEDTGLIVPVGEWVLKTACIRNKDWQEAGLSPLSVAVNLSARQFQQPNMVDTVARVLKDTGLSPGWLVLEITEGVLMQDIELTMATLQKLRGMGIKIYIDDFGTGYSSLSYLKKFPVDGIKIDKSFVSDLSCSVSDRAIVTAIIVLAQRLGLEVVAEGVETNSQLAFLRQQGCSKLQGYLFSKPVPADEIDQMLW